jgi:peptide/nickel transport system permease protein
MIQFLLRRLIFYFIAFMVALTFNFLLPRLMPGDPVAVMFAASQGRLDPRAMDAMKETFGFVEGPLWQQYLTYISSVFQGDLGISVVFFPTPVADVLQLAMGWTLFLAGSATLLSFTLGTLLGIWAAWRRGGLFDSVLTPLLLIFGAVPPVIVALIAYYVLGLNLGWFPLLYAYDPYLEAGFNLPFIKSVLYHAILPVSSIVIVTLGSWMLGMRNNMINLLHEDYLTLAVAKGLSLRRVIFQYAARNAILPVVTSFSMAIGFVLSGAVFTEMIFNYPGLGYLMLKAINARDYPLIQGQLLFFVIAVLAANFCADILYLWLDPRLRTGRH